MFDKIFMSKRIYGFFLIAILFAAGVIMIVWTKQFFGGLFVIVTVIAGLLLHKRSIIVITSFICLLSLLFDLRQNLRIEALVVKETAFFLTIIFATFTGLEMKKYINRLTRGQEEITRFNKDVVLAFVNTIDAKDQYLCGHSLNVAFYAKMIAQQLNLSPDECKNICLAGIFHDIGKIGVSERVLNKPGDLTDVEWEQIKKHPLTGSEIISKIDALREISEIIKFHHLHYDGSGYPKGPVREEIPLGARIVALADSFDAMTSDRSYRSAMTVEEACREIQRCSGSQFDPGVVEAFLKCPVIRYPKTESHSDVLEEALDLLHKTNFLDGNKNKTAY